MKSGEVRILEGQSRTLDHALKGRVFHATSLKNWGLIQQSGAIHPGIEVDADSTWRRENGFFRNIGCVSLFDYRATDSEEFRFFQFRCHPFDRNGQDPPTAIAILYLHPSAHSKLIAWRAWKDAGDLSKQIVPHIEVGYRGSIELALIEEVLVVWIDEDLTSPQGMHLRALRQVRGEARAQIKGAAVGGTIGGISFLDNSENVEKT